jgi:hypothetical protein
VKTIHRYRLAVKDHQAVMMHKDARILSVQHRDGTEEGIDMWALVDCGEAPVERVFHVVGTGAPVSDGRLDFLGTVQLYQGRLVFHVFEAVSE